MRIHKAVLAIAATALIGVAIAQSVKQISVTLAGKPLKLESVVVSGKTFVSLEQLKIALPNPVPSSQAAGGANGVAATSGCMGEWLFNGAWRLRVQKVALNVPNTTYKYWDVTVELRNGTSKTATAVDNGASGQGNDISLILQSGNTLPLAFWTDAARTLFAKTLAPGASAVSRVQFEIEDEADKPAKFLWTMSGANNYRKAPLSKEPGFRVDLSCQK